MPNIAKILLIGGGFVTATSVAGTGFYFYSQPKNIGELLTKKGKTLLDFESKEHEKHWKDLSTKHNKPIAKENNIKKIADLRTQPLEGGEAVDTNPLKNKCKDFFKTEISKGQEFDTIVNNAENWCTLDSPVLKLT